MDMLDELRALGVNVDEAVGRFMGNSDLYKRMLLKFVNMIKEMESPIQELFAAKKYDELIEKTHTIKGTTGNLSITPLYKAYTDIVDFLRTGREDEAEEIYNKIMPVQKDIVACLEKYL